MDVLQTMLNGWPFWVLGVVLGAGVAVWLVVLGADSRKDGK
jgi:hypothetical protein